MLMLIEQYHLNNILKHLRGKNRRAMELAVTQANQEYMALEKEASLLIDKVKPSVDAAFATYQSILTAAAQTFLDNIPKEALRAAYPDPNLTPRPNYASVHDIAKGLSTYYYIDRSKREALRNRLQDLQQFLHAQQASTPTKTNTKLDAEAEALLRTFDASRQLTAGPDLNVICCKDRPDTVCLCPTCLTEK
jgi:hypothetical protein